ncbi:hypothetical protein GCM10009565_37040 [Amycolatopsis albidoflavus]
MLRAGAPRHRARYCSRGIQAAASVRRVPDPARSIAYPHVKEELVRMNQSATAATADREGGAEQSIATREETNLSANLVPSPAGAAS